MIAKTVDKKLENKTIVCLPNQGNDSPKSDSKPKPTSKNLRKKSRNMRPDGSSKVMSIKDFLERKNKKILQNVSDGERKSMKENSK